MEAITAHLAHLRRLGRRKSTVYQCERALRRLAAWIDPAQILDAELVDLRAFTGRGTHGPAAQRAEVSHLKGFFRWATVEGFVAEDPALRLERPRVPNRFPRPMPDVDVTFVLTHAPGRLRPWYYLAAYAGLRAFEIGPLHADDIIGEVIIVRDQKGGGEGAAPIPRPLRRVLDELPRSGWLFPHRGHGADGPTSGAQVSKLANRWLREHGIAHSLHTLRHWYGTNTYRVRRDLRMAQRLLRHRSISTTLLYTAVNDDEAAATVAELPDLAA